MAATVALTAVLAWAPIVQPPVSAPYTVLSRDARRPLPARILNGQEMFALDDLAKLFDLTAREDTLAGGLAVSTKTQTIVLTPGQALASVAGRVVSLPAPPVRDGRSWFVPIDFVPRAVGPALGIRLDLRRPSRLIVVGDFRVPRVTGRVEQIGNVGRVTFDVAPATAHTIVQEGNRLVLRFEADALDAALPAASTPDLIQAIRAADTGVAVTIDLGPKFGSFKASDAPGERGAGRIIIDVVAPATETPPGATPDPTPAPAAPDAPP